KDAGAHIGDTVLVGDGKARVRIVGTALFPSDVHAEFDEGLWLTPAALDAATPHPEEQVARAVVLDFPNGVETAGAIARVGKALGGDVETVSTPDVPDELRNLRNVRTLPAMLAAFLALLGIAAMSHVLVPSARPLD